MSKIRNPKLFSTVFGLTPTALGRAGIFDPVLNADSKLFIDPLLLRGSKHAVISRDAHRAYRSHFEEVIRLLRASKEVGDPAWKAARKRFEFHEVQATCLGYGSISIRGSGFGEALTERVLHTAKQVIALGVEDPEMFVLMALFEEGIGADRISDMTTNVILPQLVSITQEVCRSLRITMSPFVVAGRVVELPANPTQAPRLPILLVPTDILRDLPVALDREDIWRVSFENELTRRGVNADVGEIWKGQTRKEKAARKALVLSSRAAVESLIAAAEKAERKPYQYDADPLGVVTWRHVHSTIAASEPLKLFLSPDPTPDEVLKLVRKIVEHFRYLVEEKGLWELLYHEGAPRHESNAQMIFFAVADAYCKANNIDISPEADTGNGPVDFKISKSYKSRVLVEVKLSTNTRVVHGYSNQLEIYKHAEETTHAIYLVIDVGGLGKKFDRVQKIRTGRLHAGLPASDIVLVDAVPRPSASRR